MADNGDDFVRQLKAAGGNISTRTFSQAEINKLKKAGGNVRVYGYDAEKREVTPVGIVDSQVRDVRAIVLAHRAEHPDWKSRDHEAWFQDNRPELCALADSHPRIWKAAIHPDTSQREMNRIYFMMGVSGKVQRGELAQKEADAAVSAFLMEDMKLHSGQKATEWDVMNRPG